MRGDFIKKLADDHYIATLANAAIRRAAEDGDFNPKVSGESAIKLQKSQNDRITEAIKILMLNVEQVIPDESNRKVVNIRDQLRS